MSTTVANKKELVTAIKNDESEIIIKGKLGDIIIVIKATGPIAWKVAVGGIGVAIAATVVTASTGGAAAPVGVTTHAVVAPCITASFAGAAATTATTGSVTAVTAATTAVGIAIAGGGVSVLTKIRKYKAKRENGNVILTKK